MPVLDHDHCYAAVQSRDVRFDGWFVTAVRTTGVYCRPSCPAVTPRRHNVEFFPAAAAAQQHGFRACKRCRPDAAPGSPEWNIRQDVVARAMRLIADGIVEREGVAGLAERLGYSQRHLTRQMTVELGAGPLAIARAQRAHTARTLIETSDLPLTDVAFAAGFGSVRQFNDTVRTVFASSPRELRSAARSRRSLEASVSEAGSARLRLPARRPFAGAAALRFVGERAIPGLETWDGRQYRRALALAHGPGVVDVQLRDDGSGIDVTAHVADWADLATAVERIRRLFDLDADPVAVDAALGADRALSDLVALTPGRRAPASVDPFETVIRAIVGQQVSVAGARTVGGRLVEAFGAPVRDDRGVPFRCFPTAESLAVADPDHPAWSMPRTRRDTIRRVAGAVAAGELALHVGADPDDVREALRAVPGIGPWTADYAVMRGLGHPDTFLPTDLGVATALRHVDVDADAAKRWAPWRSYAVHHLWASLGPPAPPSPPTPSEPTPAEDS